jgi:hypothetical protein
MHVIPPVPILIIVVICIIVITRYGPTPQSPSLTLDSLPRKYRQKMIAGRQLFSRLQVRKAGIGRQYMQGGSSIKLGESETGHAA